MQGVRVPRTAAELHKAFEEQVALLQITCDNFDAGHLIVGRQIAVIVRTLLLEPARGKSRTVPLFRQISAIPSRFLDLAFSIEPSGLSVMAGPEWKAGRVTPACGLVNVALHGCGAAFFAPLDEVPSNARAWRPFAEWWTHPVLRDYKGRVMSRLSLVQNVADTDGGAHVDGGLVPEYADAKSGIALGLCVERNGVRQYLANLELHCMRQIAHELLSTIQRYFPATLSKPLVHPMAPALPEGSSRIGAFVALVGEVKMQTEGKDFTLIGAA